MLEIKDKTAKVIVNPADLSRSALAAILSVDVDDITDVIGPDATVCNFLCGRNTVKANLDGGNYAVTVTIGSKTLTVSDDTVVYLSAVDYITVDEA